MSEIECAKHAYPIKVYKSPNDFDTSEFECTTCSRERNVPMPDVEIEDTEKPLFRDITITFVYDHLTYSIVIDAYNNVELELKKNTILYSEFDKLRRITELMLLEAKARIENVLPPECKPYFYSATFEVKGEE